MNCGDLGDPFRPEAGGPGRRVDQDHALGDDDPLGVETFATQRLPLSEAPDACRMFQQKTDSAVKIVLDPT
ncbi:hypothetical protein ACQPXH_17420 [Nocardia sp. CA-135953]|uniref:hypothetical protein n=1 Tax=Nocardia sp. CA-135953 TaxID=3239978 RepID=UPI003D969686